MMHGMRTRWWLWVSAGALACLILLALWSLSTPPVSVRASEDDAQARAGAASSLAPPSGARTAAAGEMPTEPARAEQGVEVSRSALEPSARAPRPSLPAASGAVPVTGAGSGGQGLGDRAGQSGAPDEEQSEDGAGEHRLTDRTGRRGALAVQLNRELMPLVAECIDMAQERDPTLAGLFSVSVHLVPIDGERVLVASLELQADNQLDDAELFECIEQSTLSIAGLPSPESFSLSIPIAPPGQ